MKTRAHLREKYFLAWKTNGYNFGFPPCCIEYFVNLETPPKNENFFRNTGFVPCPQCAAKDPQEILDYISAQRNPKLPPFPRNK